MQQVNEVIYTKSYWYRTCSISLKYGAYTYLSSLETLW